MTKREHILEVVLDLISLRSFDNADDYAKFESLYSVFKSYIEIYIAQKGVYIESNTENIEIGSYSTINCLKADVFKRLYYQKYCDLHGKSSETDDFLRQCINDFLKNNCNVYNSDNTYSNGYNRRYDIVHFNDYSIDFIDSRLWEWHIVKTYIDANDFVMFLDEKYLINVIFTILFSSIEKDKQTIQYNPQSVTIDVKIDKIRTVFNSYYSSKNLSDSIYMYLTSWFFNGNNSKIYFCNESTGRIRTFSKYIERYYPCGNLTKDEYAYFACTNFNNNTNSWDIKNTKITLDISRSTNSSKPDKFTVFNYHISSINYSTYKPIYKMPLDDDSYNYGNFGTDSNDKATYYGFIKTSKTDVGNEYFIFGNIESVKTFCYMSMSATTSNYNDFIDFMIERYTNKSMLSDASCGAFSGFIDNIYNIVKNM